MHFSSGFSHDFLIVFSFLHLNKMCLGVFLLFLSCFVFSELFFFLICGLVSNINPEKFLAIHHYFKYLCSMPFSSPFDILNTCLLPLFMLSQRSLIFCIFLSSLVTLWSFSWPVFSLHDSLLAVLNHSKVWSSHQRHSSFMLDYFYLLYSNLNPSYSCISVLAYSIWVCNCV